MKYAKATTVRLSGDALDADERMRHDYPILQQFHSKHALSALSAPSCLCCGKQTHPITRPIAVQHMELPTIVICKPCKDAAAGVKGRAALTDEQIEAMAREDAGGAEIDWTNEANLFATAPQRAAFRRGVKAALALGVKATSITPENNQ